MFNSSTLYRKMDGYLKNTMTDLKNELTAIKLLELCSAHGVKPCNCIVDNLTRRHVKIALQNYLSLNKPVPVRFFKEKYRSLFLSEIRDHRDLLHRLKKPQQKAVKKESSRKSQSQSILPVTLPTTAEYYTERYGDLNGIICKVNSIFKCITKVIENSMYSIHSLSVMDPFKFVYEEIIKDFNKFKIEIEHVQRSMNNTVDQMVQNHQAIAKTCENIAQETRKRHKSQEIYSEDGSVIMVNNDEKNYVSQLNLKMNSFIIQKTVLLEMLDKILTLTCNLIVHKNRINANFMEYYSSIVSPKQINLENIPSVHTLDDMTVSNDANLDKIESCKMFKKFPQVEPVQRTIKKT